MKNNISFGRLESLNNRKTDTLNVDNRKFRWLNISNLIPSKFLRANGQIQGQSAVTLTLRDL